MTAAPFNIVAIRISWPGQSTNDTCLKKKKWNHKCCLDLHEADTIKYKF